MKTCSTCGNEIPEDESKCRYCDSYQQPGRSSRRTGKEKIKTSTLKKEMPFVDEAMLRELIRARDPTALATAFRHRGGAPEPLCTIWEPRAHPAVLGRARARERSLRGLLEASPVRWVDPPDASRLASVNTPEDYERVRAALGPSRAP